MPPKRHNIHFLTTVSIFNHSNAHDYDKQECLDKRIKIINEFKMTKMYGRQQSDNTQTKPSLLIKSYQIDTHVSDHENGTFLTGIVCWCWPKGSEILALVSSIQYSLSATITIKVTSSYNDHPQCH